MSKARELANLGNAYSDGALSNRNLIINGAMQVAQRGTSRTGITGTNGYFTVDRFRVIAGAGTWTMTQDSHSDGPDGHRFSAKMEVTSTAAVGSTGSVRFDYFPEAQDCVHLNYGQSDAKTVTLSFWVKGSTAGTYAVSLYANDAARVIGGTYTVDAADTWEYKTVTFEGDTSGSINADNGRGLEVSWFLSAGSGLTSTDNTSWASYTTTNYAFGHGVDLANTTSGYLQITGVQLEVGDTATPFEHRSYGQELALCQRYYEEMAIMQSGYVNSSSTGCRNTQQMRVEKRAAPTVTLLASGDFLNVSSVIAEVHFTADYNKLAVLHRPNAFTSNTHIRYSAKISADAEL